MPPANSVLRRLLISLVLGLLVGVAIAEIPFLFTRETARPPQQVLITIPLGTADRVAQAALASAQANVVASASEQVSKNVATVATSAEEMSASVKEIAKNATEAARRLNATPAAVRKAKSRILHRLRQELGDIE